MKDNPFIGKRKAYWFKKGKIIAEGNKGHIIVKLE